MRCHVEPLLENRGEVSPQCGVMPAKRAISHEWHIFAETPEKFDPRDYLKPARAAMKDVCVARMTAFGQAGNAGKIKPMSIEQFASYYK